MAREYHIIDSRKKTRTPSVGSAAQGVGAMLNDLGKAEIRQLHIAVRVDQNVLLRDLVPGRDGIWMEIPRDKEIWREKKRHGYYQLLSNIIQYDYYPILSTIIHITESHCRNMDNKQ